MRLVDGHDVHRLLDYPSLVAALRKAHGGAMPEVGELYMGEPGAPDGGRGLILLPAWSREEMLGAKLVSIFPGNPQATPPHPANQGLYVAFDGVTGAPALVADGTALTLRKTAADSALGVDLLARPDAATLLVFGAGALAPHVVEAIVSVRPAIRHVWIWNRTADKARQVAAGMHMDGVRIEAVDDPDAVLPLADIVSSATMATTPLVKGALLKEGCHVDLIGGWRPDMRESDDDVIRRAALFADTRDLCRDCGDFLQPVEKGLMTWASIRADLFDLCRGSGEGRRSAGEITLFKNAGGAHLDLFTAQELLRRVRSEPEY